MSVCCFPFCLEVLSLPSNGHWVYLLCLYVQHIVLFHICIFTFGKARYDIKTRNNNDVLNTFTSLESCGIMTQRVNARVREDNTDLKYRVRV